MPKAEKVWQSVPKVEKERPSEPKAEKVWPSVQKLRKYGKVC